MNDNINNESNEIKKLKDELNKYKKENEELKLKLDISVKENNKLKEDLIKANKIISNLQNNNEINKLRDELNKLKYESYYNYFIIYYFINYFIIKIKFDFTIII